jgi:hypothetical protein
MSAVVVRESDGLVERYIFPLAFKLIPLFSALFKRHSRFAYLVLYCQKSVLLNLQVLYFIKHCLGKDKQFVIVPRDFNLKAFQHRVELVVQPCEICVVRVFVETILHEFGQELCLDRGLCRSVRCRSTIFNRRWFVRKQSMDLRSSLNHNLSPRYPKLVVFLEPNVHKRRTLDQRRLLGW